jgi:hypothetical protein
MRAVGAEGCHYTDKSLSKEERLIIVDQCLEFNYKVYSSIVADWENQRRYQKSKTIQIEDLLERSQLFR